MQRARRFKGWPRLGADAFCLLQRLRVVGISQRELEIVGRAGLEKHHAAREHVEGTLGDLLVIPSGVIHAHQRHRLLPLLRAFKPIANRAGSVVIGVALDIPFHADAVMRGGDFQILRHALRLRFGRIRGRASIGIAGRPNERLGETR